LVERTLGSAAFCISSSSVFFAVSSRAFCSSSSFIRSMSPLRMYLFERDVPLSRALRLEAISALRASMDCVSSGSAMGEERLSKPWQSLFAPFYSGGVLQHHHNVRHRSCSEVRDGPIFAISEKKSLIHVLRSKYALQTAGFDGAWLRHVCSLSGSPTFLPPSPLPKHQSDEALVRQDLYFRRFGLFPDPTTTQASKTTRITSSVFQPRAKILHHASSSGVPTTRFAPVRLLLWSSSESMCIDLNTSR
jgi:hypothetical protein